MQSKTRVNTAKEVNNKLRSRINELRRQRGVCLPVACIRLSLSDCMVHRVLLLLLCATVSLLQVLRKLEREFNDKKARMARIIADSQHANHMLGKAQVLRVCVCLSPLM